MSNCKKTITTTATSITAGSKSASPTVLGTVGFKSMVIAGPSPPGTEPAVMEGVHHRRFMRAATVGNVHPSPPVRIWNWWLRPFSHKKIFSYNNIASFVQHI